MTNGRYVPKLEAFTFPDSGITIRIRKMSSSTRNDIDAALRRQYPLPDPPMQQLDTGFGDGKPEPNPLDPEYRERVAAWQFAHMARLSDKLLRLAISDYTEIEDEIAMTQAVHDLRVRMEARGVTLDDDDRYVFFTRLCFSTDDDQRDFERALFTRTPTRDEVESVKATFQRPVSG